MKADSMAAWMVASMVASLAEYSAVSTADYLAASKAALMAVPTADYLAARKVETTVVEMALTMAA